MWKAHLPRAVIMARRTTDRIKMAHIRHILYLSFSTSLYQPIPAHLTLISALSHSYLSSISRLSHAYLTPISALSPLYRSFISALSHAHLRFIARSSHAYYPTYFRSCAPLCRHRHRHRRRRQECRAAHRARRRRRAVAGLLTTDL